MQNKTRTNTMKMSVHITKFLQVFIQQYIYQEARYDQINLLQIDHVNYGFTYKMDKIPCPHINVLPPEDGDLFRIYEASKNAQLMQDAL